MSAIERKQRSPSGRRLTASSIMMAAVALVAVTTACMNRSVHATAIDGRRAGTADGVVAVGMAAADTITPAMIALGERIFQGREAGAICATCHGKDGKGLPGLGPDLTDGAWLHGDGSVKFLENIIRTGVMQPKQGGAVMPPYGGVPLDAGQLAAVAAYVYSLSHKAGGPGNGHP
ncbi:MAG: c-type cytochrome [Gemmatimonadaceae bacterium]